MIRTGSQWLPIKIPKSLLVGIDSVDPMSREATRSATTYKSWWVEGN